MYLECSCRISPGPVSLTEVPTWCLCRMKESRDLWGAERQSVLTSLNILTKCPDTSAKTQNRSSFQDWITWCFDFSTSPSIHSTRSSTPAFPAGRRTTLPLPDPARGRRSWESRPSRSLYVSPAWGQKQEFTTRASKDATVTDRNQWNTQRRTRNPVYKSLNKLNATDGFDGIPAEHSLWSVGHAEARQVPVGEGEQGHDGDEGTVVSEDVRESGALHVTQHEQRDEEQTGQHGDRKQPALLRRLHKHQQHQSIIRIIKLHLSHFLRW